MTGRFLLLRLSALFHVFIGLCLVFACFVAAEALIAPTRSFCSVYGDGDGGEWIECQNWAEKFHQLVWIFILVSFIFG